MIAITTNKLHFLSIAHNFCTKLLRKRRTKCDCNHMGAKFISRYEKEFKSTRIYKNQKLQSKIFAVFNNSF
jgi:hypothetical protein